MSKFPHRFLTLWPLCRSESCWPLFLDLDFTFAFSSLLKRTQPPSSQDMSQLPQWLHPKILPLMYSLTRSLKSGSVFHRLWVCLPFALILSRTMALYMHMWASRESEDSSPFSRTGFTPNGLFISRQQNGKRGESLASYIQKHMHIASMFPWTLIFLTFDEMQNTFTEYKVKVSKDRTQAQCDLDFEGGGVGGMVW